MEIKTDNKFKFFKFRCDVPAKTLMNQFDHISEDGGFISYNGTWYHISDFLILKNLDLKGWDGMYNLYAFKAILIKISNDGEAYKIATYTC